MLLVDFRNSDFHDLDLELLTTAIERSSDDKVVVLSEQRFFSRADCGNRHVYWVASNLVSRKEDLAPLAACVTIRNGGIPTEIVRVSADLNIASHGAPYGSAGTALLGKLCSVCVSGGLREQALLLHGARSWLLNLNGQFGSPLASELKLYCVYVDTLIVFFQFQRPEPLGTLATCTLLDDWQKLTDGILSYSENILRDSPQLKPWLEKHLAFFRFGARARKQCLIQARKGIWCDFLTWLSVYFLQMARLHFLGGEFTVSVCCTVRALESYLTMWLVSDGNMVLDNYGIRMASRQTPQGLLAVWDLVREQVQSKVPSEQLETIREIKSVIFVRNRATLTHGVQHPGREVAEKCQTNVKNLLFLLEKLGGDHRRIFGGLLQLSSEALAICNLEEFANRAFERMAQAVN